MGFIRVVLSGPSSRDPNIIIHESGGETWLCDQDGELQWNFHLECNGQSPHLGLSDRNEITQSQRKERRKEQFKYLKGTKFEQSRLITLREKWSLGPSWIVLIFCQVIPKQVSTFQFRTLFNYLSWNERSGPKLFLIQVVQWLLLMRKV